MTFQSLLSTVKLASEISCHRRDVFGRGYEQYDNRSDEQFARILKNWSPVPKCSIMSDGELDNEEPRYFIYLTTRINQGSSYLRNNKAGGAKNIRCFPHCLPDGHCRSGFCGSSMKAIMSTTLDDNRYIGYPVDYFWPLHEMNYSNNFLLKPQSE